MFCEKWLSVFLLLLVNRGKFTMRVSAYMLELYNEKLIDLFSRPDLYDEVSGIFFVCDMLIMTLTL